METSRIARLALLAFLISLPLSALAQDPVMLNKLGDASKCFAISEGTVAKGVVQEVVNWQHSTLATAPSHGIILKMKNTEGDYLAYMGPQQFLEARGFAFHEGDKLDIEGVLASVDGKVMFVARSYTNAGSMYVLRNSEGILVSR